MRARGKPLLTLAVLAAAATAFVSCGDEPPSISFVEWRIEARPLEAGARYESLSGFASIKGGAGESSIDELWIVNDAEALAWKLTAEDWIKKDDGSDAWIGGAPFAMNDFSTIPRGQYRAVAINPAGQRAELTFTVHGDFPSKASPTLRLDSGGVSVSTSWSETLILAYDGAGELIAQTPAPTSRTSLTALFGAANADRAVQLAVYGYEPDRRMGAFSPRISVK